jgi:uncharacterized membrane protein
MSEIASDWLGFIGRLHPLLLHLPIGFITLLALIEAAANWTRFEEAASARRLLLLLSVLSVAVTAGCGWILSWSARYAEDALAWHKWLGTALVPMVMVLQVLLGRGALRAYRIWLGLTMVLLVAAGHYGSTLVRGADYLFPKTRISATGGDEVLPGKTGTGEKAEPTAFALLVQPILNEYCIGCHGAEKSKGKLRLNTAEHLLQGGESGPVVRPGSAAQSLAIKRLRLSPEEDEHMPPAGKKQPGAREIALLELWINAGAPVDRAGNELKILEAK